MHTKSIVLAISAALVLLSAASFSYSATAAEKEPWYCYFIPLCPQK